jgi:hypothetical protein
MRAAGALVWIPHTESRPIADLRAIGPDGIEVYNLHANLDPEIRRDHLGLPAAEAISRAVEFADTNPGHPEPDLALLSFLSPNTPAITRWNELLADGRRITVTNGSDAHENALPVKLADGERGDSYRRVLRWFANIALVADPQSPADIKAAIQGGRVFTAFEMMGTPVDFDVRTEGTTNAIELGGTAPRGAVLLVDLPRVRALDPSLPAPEIRATVWRVDATGPTNVASGSDTQLRVPMDTPGAYRVEISIIPRHLGPYLKDLGTAFADRELPWIYASPIYVQ